MSDQQFVPFPKMARLSRACVITEKIDGTNASIVIAQVPKPSEGSPDWPSPVQPLRLCSWYAEDASMWGMWAGSRTRFITPTDDNYGFAGWAMENQEELRKLGPGAHFGEWWGQGVQRNYSQTRKRFSLFNTHRWLDDAVRPSCCDVVPVLYAGVLDEFGVMKGVKAALKQLTEQGSVAAPGFMTPEGIVVWHDAAKMYFKKTLSKDDEWKGASA